MSNKKEFEKISRELIIMAAENSASKISDVSEVRDVKLSYDKNDCPVLDIHIDVCYGGAIPDIAWNIQTAVKKDVLAITQITVNKINIHVQGVNRDTKGNRDE